MRRASLLLQFDRRLPDEVRAPLVRGLSCAVRIGDSLWTACDETCHVERLQPVRGPASTARDWGRHARFALGDFLPLALAPGRGDPRAGSEADLEGMAYRSGYLWVLGSHARLRGEADHASTKDNFRALARVEREGNRYLLARLPLVADGDTLRIVRSTGSGAARRTAACVGHNAKGSELTRMLTKDPHFGPFVAIPGKENGLDCEGLAVAGRDRLFVGLRGPVLDGWACVLELRVADDARDPARLQLERMPHAGKRAYRKHFVDLDGRGVRDLAQDGTDLLILAGPSMGGAGSFAVFRWRNAARVAREGLVRGAALQKVLELPDGGKDDHPEGIAVWPAASGGRARLVVVYERTAKGRRRGKAGVVADLYTL